MLNNYLFDIVKLTVSGLLVLFAAFYIAKPYLQRFENQQLIKLKQAANQQTLSLRLQAYERLTLFIDRTNPVNLLVRLNNHTFSAGELHYLILTEIRNEYQHNITQQIYVGDASWEIVNRVKNDTVSLMNSAVKALPPQATGLDFGKLVLEQIGRMENNPYELAAAIIRDEAAQLLR
ncbi:DUF7935 family protein [Mucilaginibacter arboris]|uniref:Uncharacterized protein n=1 Tax=Mucilaginibacter arboris TaxID=2682090 RepID=A0A7K1T0W0_9SPHI|nr:hypothetical protein [Mucilaginibacter arboris]MVN23212.1 hypothetical protein [Mucilaginibacter arboris]